MKKPLLLLISGNLLDAHALGLIECLQDDINKHITALGKDWDDKVNPESQFMRGMADSKNTFDQQFRPKQAFINRTVPFCNVMRVESFSKYWLDILEPELGDREAGEAKKRITAFAADKMTPASDLIQSQLNESFLRLNQWIKNSGSASRRGIRIPIGQLLDPATRPFWVGGKIHKMQPSAQYWRDRLGLIHLSAGNKSCADMLVRLRFVAFMANDELPSAYLKHRNTHPHHLWLFRPSVLHGGNRRFVQGVKADRTNRTARRGSTRDLSADDYPEGERELLLMTGEIAYAHLVGLDLLEGFPEYIPTRDDDDLKFLQSIATQRAWSL